MTNDIGFGMFGSPQQKKADWAKYVYVYVSGTMGMKPNGSFTRDTSLWMTFSHQDVLYIGGKRPYGATRNGLFCLVGE